MLAASRSGVILFMRTGKPLSFRTLVGTWNVRTVFILLDIGLNIWDDSFLKSTEEYINN